MFEIFYFVYLCLALLYASVFGHMTTIIQEMTATSARYQNVIGELREFIKLHEIPKSLAERVTDYVVSSWAISNGLDTEKVRSQKKINAWQLCHIGDLRL